MRLKNIPAARPAIAASKIVIQEPSEVKGRWNEIWGSGNPIHLEIGMGKGQFLMRLSEIHPEINYVGMEMQSSVIYRAIQKLDDDPRENIRLICADASKLDEMFSDGEVSGIYLNFSDPWPKARHAKRRLTSDRFLHIYNRILAKDGQLEFKTDNKELFDWSIESIGENGWNITAMTFDLYNDEEMIVGNVPTEYEEKFSKAGNCIMKLIARR